MNSAVTLLSDFGHRDSYVGQLKGALLRVSPEIRWVDLCHEIPPQDVQAGAFVLWTAVEAFPAGTIHLAVVDPGVGSDRKAIAAQCARGDVFVGPDNGLLTFAIDRLGGLARAVELANVDFWGPRHSSTFHGRDIFAPAAGHLARGVALDALGPRLTDLERPFLWPAPEFSNDQISGRILHVDAYGNLIANIPAERLPPRFELRIGTVTLTGPGTHYQQVTPGECVALVGSHGLLEIAVRDGSASTRCGVTRGARLELRSLQTR